MLSPACAAAASIHRTADAPRGGGGILGQVRQALSKPLVAEFQTWMRAERAKLSQSNAGAKAKSYMLVRWPVFAAFLDDGGICMTNNAAERALRGIARGRKSWVFAASDRGGERAAAMYSLIVTAKMNDIGPQARLADALALVAPHPVQRAWTSFCPGTGSYLRPP